jgi:hypothetical protein
MICRLSLLRGWRSEVTVFGFSDLAFVGVIGALPGGGGPPGFGAQYTNPATLPNGNPRGGVAFSPSGDAIAVAHDGTPYITAYPWSAAGFGVKYTNPATLPTSNGRGVAFSPSGDAIAVAHDGSPFITAYPFNP